MLDGLLTGFRVIELASDQTAFAGKLLADLGAEVVLVEPPGGHASRGYEPFAGDQRDPELSLHWWYYNTSKLGVVVDLVAAPDDWRQLVASADAVLEGTRPGELGELGLDYSDLVGPDAPLVWTSVTSFGRTDPRSLEPWVDLTIWSEGGPVWSCGYDDHGLPPIRSEGGQALHTASIWAAMSTLTALVNRGLSGRGQFVDVSMFAAASVTTEAATYEWLVAGNTVQRQTARHAAVQPTSGTLVWSKDGRPIQTGVPPRTPEQFKALLSWMKECDLYDKFDEAFFLDIGAERSVTDFAMVGDDVMATAILGAARDALNLIASSVTAYEYFVGGQRHGLAVGVIYAPEEVLADPHFVARGFPTEVEHEQLSGKSVLYPGAPFRCEDAPWRISRRAPMVGEHDDIVFSSSRKTDVAV